MANGMSRGRPRSRSRSLSRDRLLEANGSDHLMQTFKDHNYPSDDLDGHASADSGGRSEHASKPQTQPISNLPFFPSSSQATINRFFRWMQGPPQPTTCRIAPLFGTLQRRYAAWVSRRRQRIRSALLLLFLFMCPVMYLLFRTSLRVKCTIPDYGEAKRLSCTSRLWPNSTICGIDGVNCRPFHDQKIAFNCPADCASVKIWNPRFIGNEEVNYRPLVIGGSREDGTPIYRGDSFICGSARHAGFISDSGGGSGVISLIGEQSLFPSVNANGISSIGFEPSFPQAFTFIAPSGWPSCGDSRWIVLSVIFISSIVVSILAPDPAPFF